MNLHFHNYQPESEDLQTAVVEGLSRIPKQLPPKFFYDETGSRIFDRICEQPEYYLPEIERGIFETHAQEMAACLGEDCHIIEPGAGSGKKIRFLLDRIRPALYAPMDISAEHLLMSAQRLARDYSALTIHAICVDHTKPYELPAEIPEHNRVFFYPGSSLGNFDPADAILFLRDLRGKAGEDGALMIGIDTKKPAEILNRAYNDTAGVTAAFNLNLLERIKNELGADLNVESFYHHAFYNEEQSRVEMHLYSRCEQKIRVNGSTFRFEAGESIHTENSYKYTVEEFKALAWEAGWKSDRVWLDDKQYFSVYLLSGR